MEKLYYGEPPKAAQNGRFSELLLKLLGVVFQLAIALLCWVAIDTLGGVRAELRSLREKGEQEHGRISVLEALQPQDRKLVEETRAEVREMNRTLTRIAARLGVE